MTDSSGDQGDELPPPFRPWQGSGVPQPGADRPASVAPPPPGELGSRRGRIPPPPVPPEHGNDAPAQWYVPAAAQPLGPAAAPPVPPSRIPGPAPATQWYAPVHRPVGPPASPVQPAVASSSFGASLRRDRYVVSLAILSALTAWLPWIKSPGASMFEFGSGSGLFATATVNAWDLPAKFLWSTGRGLSNGIELGWLIVLVPVLMVVACVRGWSTGAIRGLAGVQIAVALLFMGQTYRIIHDTSSAVPTSVTSGTTDLLGLGAYVLLALSLALLLAPRR